MPEFRREVSVRFERMPAAFIFSKNTGRLLVLEDINDIFLTYLIYRGGVSCQELERLGVVLNASDTLKKLQPFVKCSNGNGRKNTRAWKDYMRSFVIMLSKRPPDHASAPISVDLWVTRRCNFHCVHCGNDSGPADPNELSTEELLRIIAELERLDVIYLSITGGEALLREDIFEILAAARRSVPQLSLSTNGWLTADMDIASRVAKYVDSVKISLDGIRAHDRIRRSGSFARVLASIRNFNMLSVPVTLQTTVMRQNLHEIPQMLDFLNTSGLDIQALRIVPLAVIGRAKQDYRITPEEYEALMSEVRSRHYRFQVHFEHVFGENSRCSALRTSIDIAYDGTVYPCSFLTIPLGNVRDHSLREIWESDTANRVRKLLSPESLVTSCPFRTVCNGGCAANGAIIGNVRLCDYYCGRRWDYAWERSFDVP